MIVTKNNWRSFQEYGLTTDSLWISSDKFPNNKPIFLIPKREFLPKNSSTFHGLWIPEIPYQFVSRFTKKNDLVWSVFAGSGVDKQVCDLLNRRCISTDLNPKKDFIIEADALMYELPEKASLALVHPSYYNIIKYSDKSTDGSNCSSIDNFLSWIRDLAVNISNNLSDGGFVILAMGNIYQDGEEKTLGVWCKDIFCKIGFKCKAHIVKDYGETKGSEAKNYNLNYFRQLRGNYNNFYGDNIFILQKKKVKR